MDRPGQLLRDRISGHSDPREIKEALRSAFAANPWLYEFARNKLPPGQADLCGAVVIQAEADLYDHINRFREKRAGHTHGCDRAFSRCPYSRRHARIASSRTLNFSVQNKSLSRLVILSQRLLQPTGRLPRATRIFCHTNPPD
jgi:hypothetical protein